MRAESILLVINHYFLPFVEASHASFNVDLSCDIEWAKVASFGLTLDLNPHLDHVDWLHLEQ